MSSSGEANDCPKYWEVHHRSPHKLKIKYGYELQWLGRLPQLRRINDIPVVSSVCDYLQYWFDGFIKNLLYYQSNYYWTMIAIFACLLWVDFMWTVSSVGPLWIHAFLLKYGWKFLCERPGNQVKEFTIILMIVLFGRMALKMYYEFLINFVIFPLALIMVHAAIPRPKENGRIFIKDGAEKLSTSRMGILLENIGLIKFTYY